MLTGRKPFRAGESEALYEQVRVDEPQPPRQLVHGLPKELESICLRLLAKKPALRFDSAEGLIEKLQQVLRESDDRTARTTKRNRESKSIRRDFVIVQVRVLNETDERSDVDNSAELPLTSIRRVEELLSDACSISWDGDGLLYELTDTLSPSDAMERTGAIGVGLLDAAFGEAQESFMKFSVTVESAERAPNDTQNESESEGVCSADLIKRATRVVGTVTPDRVQVNSDSCQFLQRWIEHSKSHDILTLQPAESERTLEVHIEPTPPSGPRFGPKSPLAILKSRWAQAKEGLGQMVLVIGEEGTGKSRLIEDLLREDALNVYVLNGDAQHDIESMAAEETGQPKVIRWSCFPRFRERNFHPLTNELNQRFANYESSEDRLPQIQRYLAESGVSSEESFDSLSSVLSSEDVKADDISRPVSSSQKEDVHDVILKLLGNATEKSPVLFIIEDLQWADPATLEVISRLAANRLFEHLLLIATFRPEFETMWGSRAHQTQVALRPLSKKHVSKMIQSRIRDDIVDEQVIETAIRASGGVPLFIEAYLQRHGKHEGNENNA